MSAGWINALLDKKPVGNKRARIAWALLVRTEDCGLPVHITLDPFSNGRSGMTRVEPR